jgi:DNA polymerase-3 subunit delta
VSRALPYCLLPIAYCPRLTMTVLKLERLPAHLRERDPAIAAILIYGGDLGAVREQAVKVIEAHGVRPDDPFNPVIIADPALIADPGVLADEVAAVPMFGGRRIVWVRDAGQGLAKALEPLLDRAASGLVLAESGPLAKSAKLRQLFERSSTALAVTLYDDAAKDYDGLITEVLSRAGLEATDDARHHLKDLLGTDRRLARSELEKLALFAHGKGVIDIGDIDAVCGDTASTTLDEALDRAFEGETIAAARALGRLDAAGEAGTRILSAAVQALAALDRFRAEIDAGGSVDQALRTARPPIFFQRQGSLRRQLRLWDSAALQSAAATVHAALTEIRQRPALEATIAERTVLALARRAQILSRRQS